MSELSLSLIQAAQAQKYVTHNEAIELLDMIIHLTVQEFDATTPPSLTLKGQFWALDAAPTGHGPIKVAMLPAGAVADGFLQHHK